MRKVLQNVVRPFRVAWATAMAGQARLKPRTTFLFPWTLALFFFLLPLQTRWIIRQPLDHGVPYEYGTFSIYAVEVLGWIAILFAIISYFRHSEEPQGDEESHTIVQGVRSFAESTPHQSESSVRGLRMTIIAFVSLAFLSIFWSPDKWIALQAAVRLLEGILLYVVISTIAKRSGESSHVTTKDGVRSLGCAPFGRSARDDKAWLAWAFLSGAILQASLGIYQFLSQSSFASTLLGIALHDPRVPGTSVVEFADERWLRAYGGLPHPNVLGGYLVVALAVSVLMWRKSQTQKEWQRLLLKMSAPIFITGIFFTFSRAAWIAALLVIILWIIREIRCGEKFTIVRFLPHAFIVAYLALLVIVFRPLVFTRAMPNSTERLEAKSRVERVEGLRESWELIKKHPFVGVGIGNYSQAVARDLRHGDSLYSYQPVHNVPLLIFAELGIVGLVLFAAVLYTIARQSKFFILHSSFFILMLADHYFWTLPFGMMLFWAILGLSTSYKTLDIDNF